MADTLYLGKEFHPGGGTLGPRFLVDSDDLTTHGLVVGMTGSGKTGFSAVLIEECLKTGIPVLAIDPKGDLANLGFCFETLQGSQFEPWMDPLAASRDDQTAAEAAVEAASLWRAGLADWDIGPEQLAAYKSGHEFRILTPGSTAGIPVSLVDSLASPAQDVLDDAEELREQVDGVVSALLGLVRIDVDPVSSREYILLHTLIGNAWQRGETLTLEGLIGSVANPPIEKLGALPLETVYPADKRRDLMLALNGILASPQLAAWREGEPIDIDRWLHAPDGRPRLSVVYTAHLEDRDRMALTALILNRVKSWMRRQPGTGELRCLLYMDEIYGYFPPTANPPTKQPLLTLLKQARAFGVGVLLATQNPVDLDYKGLANMGFWAIGRLQTPQDQNRVREGVEAALEGADLGFDFDSEIAGVQKRVFLVHDIHRKAPALVHTRWAMSYLRGPVTKEEVSQLARLYGMEAEAAIVPSATHAGDPSGSGRAGAVQPQDAGSPRRFHAVPAVTGLESSFWNRRSGELASPHLYVRAAVRYKVGSVLTDEETRDLLFSMAGAASANEVLEGEPLDVGDALLDSEDPPDGLSFEDLPRFLLGRSPRRQIERALRNRLDDRLALRLWYDPDTRTLGQPGEDESTLAAKVREAPSQLKKRSRLEKRLEKKRLQLQAKRSEKQSRRFEKWVSLGTALLSNVRIFTGRKRTVSGAGTVLSKSRMESTAAARIEQLEAEVAALEGDVRALSEIDTSRFEQRLIKPTSTNVALLRYRLIWIY